MVKLLPPIWRFLPPRHLLFFLFGCRTFGNPLCSKVPSTSCTLPLRRPALPPTKPPPPPPQPPALACAPCAPTQTQDYSTCACITATTLEVTFTSPRLPRCTAGVQTRLTSLITYDLEISSNELSAMGCQERPGQAALMLAYFSTNVSCFQERESKKKKEMEELMAANTTSGQQLLYMCMHDCALLYMCMCDCLRACSTARNCRMCGCALVCMAEHGRPLAPGAQRCDPEPRNQPSCTLQQLQPLL